MTSTLISPVRFNIALEDGSLAGLHWPNPDKPPLLFCHATGFCASTYKHMLAQLADQFDVYAIDMRGHGKTNLPINPSELKSWHIYASDIQKFLDIENRNGWTIAGHSMGGVTAVTAADGRDDIKAVRLVEPVAVSSALNLLARTPLWEWYKAKMPLVKQAAGRRATWADRDEVIKAYSRKRLFSSWAPGALENYLEDGLKAGGDGVGLSCHPEWEAATFGALANRFWPVLRAIGSKTKLLAVRHPTSTVPAFAHKRLAALVDTFEVMDGASHLAPMESPKEIAQFISA
ncbi:alpha/beta hydrolase [Hyphococcus formosus]|uniref:alpha/beta fold hydrolase n=1 Tax=Hyphococcus formosus TaxID=3143534 RepID=UPI00398B967C